MVEKSSLDMRGYVEVQGKQVWIQGQEGRHSVSQYMDEAFNEEDFIRVAINGIDQTEGFLVWDEDDSGDFPTIQPIDFPGYCLCGVLNPYEGQDVWLNVRQVDVPGDHLDVPDDL